ncbi:MAG: KpsF/GutQ family sugar-phosphate isomerase [Alphaproteobacteria bacterium]|nr:KpsF/GutQ family sugar-phosphate isomerase [Alphaproteobacteria bacterium]
MDSKEIIEAGRRVLDNEASAVKDLSKSLSETFVDAVHRMFQTRGRVIVSGMGKSGHVGVKIASTLASVGTPSFFLHPAEASHGDLGMITKDDILLAISNSGESHELSDLIYYSRRFNIPMIAITGNKESTLGKQSDCVLEFPKFKEACVLGVAPTTSTTMTLALGDALAETLLEMRGFSKEQYHNRHPGGKLGRKLVKVSEIMSKGEDLPLISPETKMTEALIVITNKSLGTVGIVDKKGALIGVICDGDLRRNMSNHLLEEKAEEVMTPFPKTVPADMLAAEALRLMNEQGITSFFVLDDKKKPIGLLHIHDCLRAGV